MVVTQRFTEEKERDTEIIPELLVRSNGAVPIVEQSPVGGDLVL
jgi:hypothetical protein